MVFQPLLGADLGTAWSFLMAITEQTDKRKVAVLYCREASTCSNQVRRFRELLPYKGLEVVYEAQVSIAQPDYTAEMIAARNAGAEVVMSLVDAPTVIRMARSAHRQGWSPIFSGTHNLNHDSILPGGAEIEGLLAVERTAPYMTSPMMRDYHAALDRYQPGAPKGGVGAGAWVTGKLMEKIAGRLGEPPTREQLFEGLYSLNRETLGGLLPGIAFKRGPHERVNLCMIPIRFTGGKFVPKDGREQFVCAPGWQPGG